MYTSINEFLKNKQSGKLIKENFDEPEMGAQEIEMPEMGEEGAQKEEQELTFEIFASKFAELLEMHNSQLEEGQEPVEMISDEQMQFAFDACKALCTEEEDEDEDEEVIEEGIKDFFKQAGAALKGGMTEDQMKSAFLTFNAANKGKEVKGKKIIPLSQELLNKLMDQAKEDGYKGKPGIDADGKISYRKGDEINFASATGSGRAGGTAG